MALPKSYGVNIDLNKNEILNFRPQNLSTHPDTTGWSGIHLGFTYYNTTDLVTNVWNGSTWKPSGATDLSYTQNAANGVVVSSSGNDAIIPLATTTLAGLLDPADKVKINKVVMSDTTDVGSMSWVINDATLAANSSTQVPTQASVKAYVDNLILTNGSLVYQTDYNASTNSPDLDTTPSATIKKGWTYVVNTAGTFFTEAVEAGDMIIAKQNAPTTLAHWSVINKNIPDVLSTLLVGFTSGAGTITSSDSILSAIQKLNGNIDLRAPLSSPALTGTPTAPTPATGDNSTTIATTAFVKAQGYTNNVGTVQKVTATIGDGVATNIAVTHALGADVIAQIRFASNNNVCECDIVLTNATTVTFSFNVAPAANSLKVVILG